MARADAAAADLVFAVVLLGRQAIDEHHLGGHRITALDVADVVTLDAPRWMLELEQLGQIFCGELLLFGAALSPGQLKARIALHHLNEIGLLLPLRHLQDHLAAAAITQPCLQQFLLWQWVLQQHFSWQLHRIQLAVVLLQNPLQDRAWLSGLRIGGEAQSTHQLARSDLEQLHRSNTLVGR